MHKRTDLPPPPPLTALAARNPHAPFLDFARIPVHLPHPSADPPPPPLPPLAELGARNPLPLSLDFDGTLVEIADTPDGIQVPDGLPAQLVALRRALDGRIAIVSGRAIADIQSWLGPSDLLMVGSHGAEIGEPATGAAILSDASRAALAALTAAWPRLLVETKPHGIAVHYRPEPAAAPAVFTVMDDMAAREGLAARRGKMVVEQHGSTSCGERAFKD